MSYCLKPACSQSRNPKAVNCCLICGSYLLAQERYRALKPIGQGGMGRTFLAVDESYSFKPLCVIKQFFLPDQNINHKRRASALFRREALRLEALGQHPQIPPLLDYVEQNGQQYLVQEFINGQNLEQELAETGAFNEAQLWQLLNDLLPVLQFVHDHQIIHRDIKPANIIRRYCDGQLDLVDFGAAKCATGSALAKTRTVIGSAEYAAPEQTRGKVVFASDLYSLGVTCIHLLTQIPPFDVFDSSEDTWVWRCYLGSPVSQSLDQVLDKLLQNATKWRYQSSAAVLRDLNSEPTQGLTKSLLTVETGVERRSDTAPAKSTSSSVPFKPVLSVTVFDPQTQFWYRIPNLSERSASVWAVAPFPCSQAASPSVTFTCQVMRQVASTIVEYKRREIPWWVLIAIWIATSTCLAIGLRLQQPSLSPKVPSMHRATTGMDALGGARLKFKSPGPGLPMIISTDTCIPHFSTCQL